MADGSTKNIADVVVGDVVVATDPGTGVTTASVVTHLHLNQDGNLVDLTIAYGDQSASIIKTTGDHPFWSETRQLWIDAGKLEIGEELASAASGNAKVVEIKRYRGNKLMHDLTVDVVHAYYVLAGDAPVLVHNSCPAAARLTSSPDAPVINSKLSTRIRIGPSASISRTRIRASRERIFICSPWGGGPQVSITIIKRQGSGSPKLERFCLVRSRSRFRKARSIALTDI
ncbi:polymorphic toxin-type HINT domain-containing protein [Polymorphospora rubra]|uniref:polymorphic toxin-type HINT domain-containing protein n=1 Tax=Polymorphospora rubra TaxID=338584 RepID=UPI0031D70085